MIAMQVEDLAETSVGRPSPRPQERLRGASLLAGWTVVSPSSAPPTGSASRSACGRHGRRGEGQGSRRPRGQWFALPRLAPDMALITGLVMLWPLASPTPNEGIGDHWAALNCPPPLRPDDCA
jgi:hypothetical protein